MRLVSVQISPTKHTSNIIKVAAQIQTGVHGRQQAWAGIYRPQWATAGSFPWMLLTVLTSIIHVLFCFCFFPSETWNSSFHSFLLWLRWSGNIWFNLCEMMLASIPPPSQRSEVTWGADRAHTEAEKPCSHWVSFFPCEKEQHLLKSWGVLALRST